MSVEGAWHLGQQDAPSADGTSAVLSAFGLPHVFSPAEAAGLLRSAGLSELTECALRTRAYRKRVPFHLNGRRIVFTLGDLREIAEGEARRPQLSVMSGTTPQPTPRRRPLVRRTAATSDPWRARKPHEAGWPSAVDGGRTSET
jgi:hypothetical protein